MTAALLVASGTAQGKKKPKKPAPPADLAGHVNYLALQLYGLHLDESGPLASEIQNMVLDHFRDWLAQHPASQSPKAMPYVVLVRGEMENVFSKLRHPVYADPAVFTRPWKDRVLICVGYTLGWSDTDRVNTLALFEERAGKTQLDSVTNFLPRTDLHYEFLAPPASEDFWFVAYGTRLGKSHPRLSAVLYDFNGRSLKSLWQVEDAYDGTMDFEKDTVLIRYMKEGEFIEAATYGRRPPRREAVYKIAPQGLELQADREIPSSQP